MDIEITLSPNYFIVGYTWFGKDEVFDYFEFNVYLLVLKISFKI